MESPGETVCSSGMSSFSVVHVRNPIFMANANLTTCRAIRPRMVRRLSLHQLNVTPQGLAPLGARGRRVHVVLGTDPRLLSEFHTKRMLWVHYLHGTTMAPVGRVHSNRSSSPTYTVLVHLPRYSRPQSFCGLPPSLRNPRRYVTLAGIRKRRCSPTTVVNVGPYTAVTVGIPPTDGACLLYDNMQLVPFFCRPPGPAPNTGTTKGSSNPYSRTVPCHRTPVSCSQGLGEHRYGTSYKSLGGGTLFPNRKTCPVQGFDSYVVLPHPPFQQFHSICGSGRQTLGNSANS